MSLGDDYNSYDYPRDVIWDEKFDWKPSRRPVPTAGICDEPCKCIKVNTDWLPWVIPALLRVGHSDIWAGTEQEKQFAFEQVDYLIGMLMACDCGGGKITAPPVTYTVSATEVQQWYDQSVANYATYNPETPSLIGDGNGDIATTVDAADYDEVLCAVLKFMVEAFARLYEQMNAFVREGSPIEDWINDKAQNLREVAVAYSIASIFIPMPDELIVTPFLLGAAEMWEEIAKLFHREPENVPGVPLPEDSKERLHCYLYENLLDVTITFQKWLEVATNAAEIDEAIEQGEQTPTGLWAVGVWTEFARLNSTYYMLIELTDRIVTAAQTINAIPECPCCNKITVPLQSLKRFPTPFSGQAQWPEYTGGNVYAHAENYYIVDPLGSRTRFPQNRFTMKFDPAVRITNDFRIRILHKGGGAATHTFLVTTNCGSKLVEESVGAGGGDTNVDVNISLDYLDQSTAERVRHIEVEYWATNNQPLIVDYVDIRALLA